ncbi:MAG: hypothetical protein IPL71_22335 [Anaerolineales bacterium]|nr:hypothetical protein [Anaerolineales bacterium]
MASELRRRAVFILAIVDDVAEVVHISAKVVVSISSSYGAAQVSANVA